MVVQQQGVGNPNHAVQNASPEGTKGRCLRSKGWAGNGLPWHRGLPSPTGTQ